MGKNRKKGRFTPDRAPKRGGSPPQSAVSTPPMEGGDHLAFAETVSDKPVLGSEIATREVIASLTSLSTLPNPDPILRAEGKSISVYRSFVDGHLKSILRKRKAAVRARPWTIEPGTADKASVERILKHFSGNLKLRTIIGETLNAPPMGSVYQEVVWERIDGWILPVRIEAKPQEWFTFTPNLELRLVTAGGRLIEVPPRKILHTSHEATYDNPYGNPIMSECFWPLVFKKGGLKFWMLFCEKYGIPRTVGKVPASTPEADRARFLSALASMVRDAVAVIPNNATVDLLETKIGGDGPFQSLVRWADSEMSKAVLGETLTTEIGNIGSRAAAQVHNDVRSDLAMDDASMVEETMNQLIKWTWEYNRPGDGDLPWFQIQMPEDLQQGRIERDKGLYSLGARFTPAYFLDTYGIAPQHLAKIADPKASPDSTFAEHLPGCGCGGHQFAEGAQSDLEALLRSFTPQELQGQVSELVQPIIELAERSGSYGEFETALDELFPHLTTRQMEAALTKCALLSEMLGRDDAETP